MAVIIPERAPVRPRVTSITRSDPFLLEDEILRLLEAGAYGAIQLLGAPGSGKTTALAHLAAIAAGHSRLVVVDNEYVTSVFRRFEKSPRALIVGVPPTPVEVGWIDTFWMAPWTNDELIEYLLAKDKQVCSSVMSRFSSNDLELVRGCSELCVLILDELRSQPELSDGRAALCRGLERVLTDIQHARSICADILLRSAEPSPPFSEWLVAENDSRWLRHPAVHATLGAQHIAADLHYRRECADLKKRWRREVVNDVARLIKADRHAIEFLCTLIFQDKQRQSMCASLLHAVGDDWTPPAKRDLFRKFEAFLDGAYLAEVRWPAVALKNAHLTQADLTAGDLHKANLDGCTAFEADLSNVNLSEAILTGARFDSANLSSANLCSVHALGAVFSNANLEQARFDEAKLGGATFDAANLTDVSFFKADLSKASLLRAQIDGADFRFAVLDGADLTKLDLRPADFRGALMRSTYLVQCDLQSMCLDGIDFRNAILEGADLTGASLAGANLTQANLRMTGLADVNMEGACLQRANLHGATFHMGSSRSGLLFTPLASEGTRTGFYTDDFDDQTFKAPEEIRKANLRGADLRGARVDTVDFYLVDLRDALYDPVQEEHFRRCGAILEDLCKK